MLHPKTREKEEKIAKVRKNQQTEKTLAAVKSMSNGSIKFWKLEK
jgi:hypothetical protein